MPKMQVLRFRGGELVLGTLAWIEATFIVAKTVEYFRRRAGGGGIKKDGGGGEAD